MSFWNIERIDILRQGVVAGKSFREISLEIGCSRLAALGKWNRIRVREGHKPIPRNIVAETGVTPELMRNTSPKRVYNRATPAPGVASGGVGFILPAVAPPAPRSGPAVGIADVTGCKWPIGEDPAIPGGHTFCNHAKEDGKPYCEYHTRQSIAPFSRELRSRTLRAFGLRFGKAAA